MSVKIATTFTNPNLPSSLNYDQQAINLASCVGAYQADAAWVQQTSGAIAALVDRKGTAATFSQISAAPKPTLTTNQINGFTAAVFDGGDYLSYAGATFDPTLAFTIAVIYKEITAATAAYVWAKYLSSGPGTYLMGAASVDTQVFQHGNGSITMAATRGIPHVAICSSNTTQIRARLDGVSYTPVATNNSNIGGIFNIGSLYAGTSGFLPAGSYVSDLFIFNTDILSTDLHAVSLLEKHARYTYGLNFTPLEA